MTAPKVIPALLTVAQCAELLQCSVSLVEHHVRSGRLRRVQLPGREVGKGGRGPRNWRVRPESLQEFIDSCERFEAPPARPGAAPAPAAARPPAATGTDGKRRARLPRGAG